MGGTARRWEGVQGQKELSPLSEGDRNGGNMSILASNNNPIYEIELNQIFNTEANCMSQ